MQDIPILSRRLAAVTCLALVGSLGVAASPAPASPAAPPDWLPELVDSRELSGPPVAEGMAWREGGGSPAIGAQVALYAHPNSDGGATLDEADLGMTPLAKTMSGPDGSFTLRIDPAAPLGRLWSEDGIIDTVLLVEQESAWVPSGVVVGTESGEPGGTPDAEPAVEWGPAAAGPCPNGLPRQVWSLGKRKVVVGEIHIRTIYGHGRFIYRSGASSTLEVAFSTTGSYGSFSGSGTATRSSSLTSISTWYQGYLSDIQDTEFVYQKVCFTVGAFHYYEVEAVGHAGGRYPRAWSTPSATYCVRYPAGETVTWEDVQSTAFTFGAGAKLAGAIGIDLSSRTGFHSQAVTEFRMDQSRRLCGSHQAPGMTPRRLVLKV